MGRQVLGLYILHHTENQPDNADDQADVQNHHAGKGAAHKTDLT